jgi:glucokinase
MRYPMFLVGDIGGTKSTLAVISSKEGARVPIVEMTFPSRSYPDLEAMLSRFLEEVRMSPDTVCLGVAGPVVEGRAKITNLPWMIDARDIKKKMNLRSVHLLNDLEAIAWAVPHLKKADIHTLNPGKKIRHGAMAVTAPGTGLGEAFLTWDENGYRAHPSEGGHTDFAPTSEMEAELLSYLRYEYSHVSYEVVCSGKGIPNIYAFFKEKEYDKEPVWLSQALVKADDPVPVIVDAALDREIPCKICIHVMDTFTSILGAEAGNLALKVMATGGVFLGGGLPPRILPFLEKGLFMDSFRRKGRMSEMLSAIPVHVIMNPKAALLGAAYYGLRT